MGLGAPKRRSKLSHDPNNTNWSNSTNTFGHKILTAQGWQPGDYLGAVNAEHAGHYTAANASHIRILLREDNLGLGAQVGKTNAETFGLSLFSGVLGRLNGKSDVELQRHQSALKEAELRTYHAQKYGLMNFVRGGWLVGDQIKPTLQPLAPIQTQSDFTPDREPKAKKRKIESKVEVGENEKAQTKIRSKAGHDSPLAEQSEEHSSEQIGVKIRKKRKVRSENTVSQSTSLNSATTTDPEDKSSKKRQKKPRHEDVTLESEQDERTRAKSEKRARKEERRKRREERRQLKAEKRIESEAENESSTTESKPTTGTSAPVVGGNRHAVRQRYIQQKRMASMDAKAMKEIFMLSAAG